MSTNGDLYERELKSILSGDEKIIERMIKTFSDEERESYLSMKERPFMVVRAAGSHGVDLIALRWDFSFPIEVKSSAEYTLHFSRSARLGEQADWMLQECSKSMILPIYAMRLKKSGNSVKGDPWRLFCIPCDFELKGSAGLLQRRLPKLTKGPSGNYIMNWNEGMKLSDFFRYANAMMD
ncbi:MAG: Holliday junction resolvase [Thermoplasmata archaeon]|nr:Holliday junction resolvase [Thermoplasmata archaeon]